jgi:hypothetical protein
LIQRLVEFLTRLSQPPSSKILFSCVERCLRLRSQPLRSIRRAGDQRLNVPALRIDRQRWQRFAMDWQGDLGRLNMHSRFD